jgi:hypothetical protein
MDSVSCERSESNPKCNVRLRLTPPLTTFATLSVFPLPLKRREKGKPGMSRDFAE